MTNTQTKRPVQEIQEIRNNAYSLLHVAVPQEYRCAECNTDKEGLHMEHSIYFDAYTDTVPMCMDCVNQHYTDYNE